jgi:hypothetical protein
METTSHAQRVRLLAVAFFVVVVVFLQVGWFYTVFQSPDPAATALRDWISFYRTGLRVVSGSSESIYPVDFSRVDAPEFLDRLYFLYPPFFAWITLPLALFSPIGAYWACVAAVASGSILAAIGYLTLLGVKAGARIRGLLGVMASAPWNGAMILGHLGVLLVVPPALALWAWSRRRPFLTGLALALLLAKPNWGIPIFVFLGVGRLWKQVAGVVLGNVLLFLASLPLGPGLWKSWMATMVGYREFVTDRAPPWKQATFLATLESLLGGTGSDPRVLVPWFVGSTVLFGWTALVWFRFGRDRERFPRLLGVGLLSILVTNPYGYFYDGLLVTPLALILWFKPEMYSSPTLRRWGLVVFSGTYGWMLVQYFFLMDLGPSLAGLGLGLWLVLELTDLGKTPRLSFQAHHRGPDPLHGRDLGRESAAGLEEASTPPRPWSPGIPGSSSPSSSAP